MDEVFEFGFSSKHVAFINTLCADILQDYDKEVYASWHVWGNNFNACSLHITLWEVGTEEYITTYCCRFKAIPWASEESVEMPMDKKSYEIYKMKN